MAEPKTKLTDQKPEDFINSVDNEQRRKDAFVLLEMFSRVTGLDAKMWGPAIVGFGSYTSKSGDWPLAAFSPRKQNLTLYVYPNNFPELLENLGKFTTSTACLYIYKLDDVDLKKLEELVDASYKWSVKEYA